MKTEISIKDEFVPPLFSARWLLRGANGGG